jgi:uncharacterized protein (DUF58 family)
VAPNQWLPFLGGLFLLGALLRFPFLATFSASLAVLIGVASWWKRRALDEVSYRRKPYFRRAFPGERVGLQLEVENRKLLPLSWLRVEDPWARAVGPEDESILTPSHIMERGFLTHVFSLRWFERARRRYTLLFRKRGMYKIGPALLRSGDPLGMYEQTREYGPVEYLTVFPELVPLSELDLPAEDPFGDRRSRRRVFEDPNRPMGVREYRPEDSFRRIHWPATARTGQLQVKVYQPTSAQVLMVCMNVTTARRHWEGVYPALMERLVSVAATLVYHGVQAGYQVGLMSNGCLAHSDRPFSLQPGSSPDQLAHLLQALAGVTPFVTAPFEKFLLREMPKVRYGASLVIVTALTTPELIESLQRLKSRGRRLTLLSLAEEQPPNIPGIRNVHIPFKEKFGESN